MSVSLDLETYSRVDLKSAGLDNYASDESTGIHCMSYGTTADDIRTWIEGEAFPEDLAEHLGADGIITAWNAAFEISLWLKCAVKRYGWPMLKVEQVRCSMAQAYAMGLPGALENAAPALGVVQRKDAVGKRVMLSLAQPKADGSMWRPEHDPEKFARLYEYNRQDVRTELAIRARLMELSPVEQKLWALDYKINQRGILVELPAIEKGLALVKSETARLNAEMLKTTGGVVGSCSEVQLLVKWIRAQGVQMKGVAKAALLDALDGELPPQVRKALELRKEAAKSSTAKLLAMKERASADGRVRGAHQYHGAATGRWAGRGVQIQNLPRPRHGTKPKDIEDMFSLLGNRDMLDVCHGPVLDALADCVRGTIIAPPGHDLVAVDFSAIEARVLAWLAGEQHVLDTFVRKEDLYKAAASRIYGVSPAEVTKDQRQIGKVATLALGYGGGKGAFQAMAEGYGVKVDDELAEDIKTRWRFSHPCIVEYWYELEAAAIGAVAGGYTRMAGPAYAPVQFKKSGSFLWCKLPSGRVLCYPYPETRTVTTPWGAEKEALTYMTVVSNVKAKVVDDPGSSGSWKRISTYGGSLAENVTQAVARDLLAEAMTRLDAAGYTITCHIHDEVVVEIETRCDADALSRIEALMAEAPAWANGLPLAAEGWRARRYRK